jgi:hypothetical protein
MKRFFGLFLVALAVAAPAVAEGDPVFSARAGVGTDINLGIAVGGGVGYLQRFQGLPPVDFGLDLYYSHSVYSEQSGAKNYTYTETTTLVVYAVTANFMHGYHPGQKGFYFHTGVGVGAVSVDWDHYSPQDTSGYNASGKYTGAGLLVNLGASYAFGSGLEARLQAPILVFNGPLGAVGFAPMLNLVAAMRF